MRTNDATWDYTVFEQARRAIYVVWSDEFYYGDRSKVPEDRTQFRKLSSAHPLHPAVKELVQQHRPKNWQELLLEWPARSVDDPEMLAYSRNEAALAAARRTKTSVGKYVRRHWPHLADHVIRDVVAKHSLDQIEITTDHHEMIWALEMGPQSCMTSSHESIPFDEDDRNDLCSWKDGDLPASALNLEKHPYIVYEPSLGWGMAYRLGQDGKTVMGRALVWTNPLDEGDKRFVRTYARAGEEGGYSHTDHKLQAWLESKGYTFADHWKPGTRFAYVEHPDGDGAMMPYLDGNIRTVNMEGRYMVLDSEGSYTCDNTDGTVCKKEVIAVCDDCECDIYEDDTYHHVGLSNQGSVCGSCFCDDYTEVRIGLAGRWSNYTARNVPTSDIRAVTGRHGWCTEYYVHEDSETWPPGVVELENGDLMHCDDTVVIDGEYYAFDDERVVELTEETSDGDTYALRDNTWVDAEGNLYHDEVEHIDVDGNWYRKGDCFLCYVTNVWYYTGDVTPVEDNEGNQMHPDAIARVNSDSEWGDTELGEIRAEIASEVVPPVVEPPAPLPEVEVSNPIPVALSPFPFDPNYDYSRVEFVEVA